MKVKFEHDSIAKMLARRNMETGGLVQQFIDSEVLRKCDPYVPRDNGILIDSGILNTVIGSGEVVYDTPYARRWYYEPAEFQGAPTRGNYWVMRMLNEGGRESILRGACKLAGAKKG